MSLTIRDKNSIIIKLNEIHELSLSNYQSNLTVELSEYIKSFSLKTQNATSALTNLITCLICNATDNEIDPRYHRKPSQEMPKPESGENNWFSGRSISERVIYPWLSEKKYRTAKSGWQTRTFERPRPYKLDYPENIAFIKNEFLEILNAVVNNDGTSIDILVEIFRLEQKIMANRQALQKRVAKNTIGNEILISDVINMLIKHFSIQNSSILPVYALYSIYKVLNNEIKQYSKFSLKELDAHESSDKRTGSIGDIELVDSDNDVIEAVEIKHGIPIDQAILLRVEEKIKSSSVKRYYILTTHINCNPEDEVLKNIIERVYREHGCQIIVNGVIPTIKYYLRLLSDPKEVVNIYSDMIASEESVKYDQLAEWNNIVEEAKTTYNSMYKNSENS